jgi:hypothetical protein
MPICGLDMPGNHGYAQLGYRHESNDGPGRSVGLTYSVDPILAFDDLLRLVVLRSSRELGYKVNAVVLE